MASPGWQCLEVGGGGGSIAAWLAARVGAAGRVLVTDIDTRFLESLKIPNLEVRRHSIVSDPLPEAAFDLVHSRLVLVHLPEREKALARMVAALKPGGWLVDEEFDFSISPDPSVSPGEVLSRTYVAMTRILDDRGVDRRFGRRLFGLLRAHGLVSVAAEGRIFMWDSESPGASLRRWTYEQLRDDRCRLHHGARVRSRYRAPERSKLHDAIAAPLDDLGPSALADRLPSCHRN